MSEKGHINR